MPPLKDGDVVVIVGAGVIGLCTAYQLARLAAGASPKLRIKIRVIDAAEAPFTAASSSNSAVYNTFSRRVCLGQFLYWAAIHSTCGKMWPCKTLTSCR